MPSENARSREVQRYYQTWLQSSFDAARTRHASRVERFHHDGSLLRTSPDKSLIAFVQLGCFRLHAKRAVVTLIDATRQYILAEATQSLSLVENTTDTGVEDELWFGNASFPRSQGMSEAVLTPAPYTATGPDGQTYTALALVINDTTQHERYKNNAYAGRGVTFYCGVPITSNAGHVIGSYTVVDDKPREGLTPSELKFVHDMAQLVMDHLEGIVNDVARFRGEDMVQGLDEFIRGRSSLSRNRDGNRLGSGEYASTPALTPFAEPRASTRQFRGLEITDVHPGSLQDASPVLNEPGPSVLGGGRGTGTKAEQSSYPWGNIPGPEAEPRVVFDQRKSTKSHQTPADDEPSIRRSSKKGSKLQDIFTRAARILRESTRADGVIFFDATPTNRARSIKVSHPERETEDRSGPSGPTVTTSSDPREGFLSSSVDSDGSDGSQSTILTSKTSRCPVLGFSLDLSAESTTNARTVDAIRLTERSLRRFIRRFPKGKTFHYNPTGDVSTSEGEDHGRPLRLASQGETASEEEPADTNTWRSKAIAAELVQMLPGARNVVWLPLWDFTRRSWFAGAFLWSSLPHRLLHANDDLKYLKVFGSSILHEVLRINAQSADKAKSNFIANVSHELRSPLHGILGSIEFLQETTLDDFQASLARSTETCAKTLLETVEHVLSFSKMNQITTGRGRSAGSALSGAAGTSQGAPAVEHDVDLAELFEEAVEAVFADQIFRRRASTAQQQAEARDTNSPSPTDETKAISRLPKASAASLGAVSLILDIEKQDNWWVRTEPGAIRRIVMNLLGNALKFTDRGSVQVSLTTHNARTRVRDPSRRTIHICVKDTGRGMSPHFLEHDAFVPFRQESQFSVGTGLGLSIVRQIVESLRGHISLQSEENSGTTFNVYITLPVTARPRVAGDDRHPISSVLHKVSQKSICIVGPAVQERPQPESARSGERVDRALERIASNWFDMRTTTARSMDEGKADFYIYTTSPSMEALHGSSEEQTHDVQSSVIIMATNPFESAALIASGIHRGTGLGRNVEIISQPCGPRKLAKALDRCLAKAAKAAMASTGSGDSLATNRPSLSSVDRQQVASNNLAQPRSPPELSRVIDQGERPAQSSTGSYDGSPEAIVESGTESAGIRPQYPIGQLERESPAYTSVSNPAGTGQGAATNEAGAVLLVDDNDINLSLLVMFMKKAQRPYRQAKDGLQAVEAYQQASLIPGMRFAFVLIDISMPVMDGITATRLIRQHEKTADLAKRAIIIALTGLGADHTRKEMLDAGADYYLTKPVKFKELMELFQTIGTIDRQSELRS